MSYFRPCDTTAPLFVTQNNVAKFKVNGSLNAAMLTHPYTYISSNISARSSYSGIFTRETARCEDMITPVVGVVKYAQAPPLITTCNTEASSHFTSNTARSVNTKITEFYDTAEGYILLNPCCLSCPGGTASGGGGIRAALPGRATSGLNITREYTSNLPYCTSCTPQTEPCNPQSRYQNGPICVVLTEAQVKDLYCGPDEYIFESEDSLGSVFSECSQADANGDLPFYGDFKGIPGRSYIEYSFSAGIENDTIELASARLIAELPNAHTVHLEAPGAIHIETTGVSATAIFDNFTKPTYFKFSASLEGEYEETNPKPWGSGPLTEDECGDTYLQYAMEKYSFSYTQIINL